MTQDSNARPRSLPGSIFVALKLLAVAALPAIADPDPWVGADAEPVKSAETRMDPAAPDQLMRPEDLARLLADRATPQPAVLHVGFTVLFPGGHPPGARHIGPASTPEGLAALKQVLRETSNQQVTVLYCGPWNDCPNVRPAIQAAREMGLKNVQLLYLPNSLRQDWIDKGLPISKREQ
jgi:thiosulfate/3-mercaptopyruvate sulfurtransferase